ncbi:hypothetical protein J4408_03225 [Candidatus Pacearchaeota archaeon]|nr:hypothetical protein [Candidatus Pacearchaeota archaeon]
MESKGVYSLLKDCTGEPHWRYDQSPRLFDRWYLFTNQTFSQVRTKEIYSPVIQSRYKEPILEEYDKLLELYQTKKEELLRRTLRLPKLCAKIIERFIERGDFRP